ncbi:MAG: fumarylacetoacetate hydrolase family protein [Hyphomicrobiaceae bacterium]
MNDLARQLWEARRDGTLLARDRLVAPADAVEAYAVQAEAVRLSGLPTRGFKVGSTSLEAQRKLGTTEPGSAPLLAPWVHESPARVALIAGHNAELEGEIAFRLGHDLPPRGAPYTYAEVAEAIDAAAGAIEVVGSRISGGLAGIGRFLSTADFGVNIALVVGPWRGDWRTLDLQALSVSMTIDGSPAGQGTGARALGDPMNVMVWLANQQSARGRGLLAGEMVSTGTCTGLDPVHAGQTVRADFGGLGAVAASFE